MSKVTVFIATYAGSLTEEYPPMVINGAMTIEEIKTFLYGARCRPGGYARLAICGNQDSGYCVTFTKYNDEPRKVENGYTYQGVDDCGKLAYVVEIVELEKIPATA